MSSKKGGATEMSKTDRIKQQVAETKGVMQANIQKVIDRGEKMEVMAKNSEDMMSNAAMFKKKATEVKHNEQWKNMKMILMVFGILGVLGLIIFLSICRGLACVGA